MLFDGRPLLVVDLANGGRMSHPLPLETADRVRAFAALKSAWTVARFPLDGATWFCRLPRVARDDR